MGPLRFVWPSGRVVVTQLPAGEREVWWCELPDVGRRPVVVLSRDTAIARLRRTAVAPCTTTIRELASEVLLAPDVDPIALPSAVNLDSIENVAVGVLTHRLGRLGGERMAKVCAALEVAVDCSSPIACEPRFRRQRAR